MNKLTAATLALTLLTSSAMAGPPHHNHGPIYDQIDELEMDLTNGYNDGMYQAKRDLMSGVSAATAMAGVPDNGDKYIGAALGMYGDGQAIAVAGGMNKSQYGVRVGLTYDDSYNVGAVIGASYKF